MSAVRPPVIAGLAASAGSSTLAAALHARDGGLLGRHGHGAADVVACRSTGLAAAAATGGPPSGPRPVLAVLLGPSADDDVTLRAPGLRRRFAAVVLLPHVAAWHGRADVRAEAASALALPSGLLSAPLSAYAAELRVVVEALGTAGLLTRSTPPFVTPPRTVALWRGLHPVERAAPRRPVLLHTPRQVPSAPLPGCSRAVEPDDEALEDEPAAAGRAG